MEMAKQRSVSIQAEVADLTHYTLPVNTFDLIVSIFAHVPPRVRQQIHAQIATALVPGGTFVLEAYTPSKWGAERADLPLAVR